MKALQQILTFYKKNRVLILGTLLTLIAIHWCSQNGEKRRTESVDKKEIKVEQLNSESNNNIETPQQEPDSKKSIWFPYLLMVGLVLLVFLLQRKKWLEKLLPGFLIVQTKVFRSKENKRHMMRLFVANTSKSNQTLSNPIIEFMRPGSTKAFSIHATGTGAFPITMTKNTSHILTIDLDRFYEKVPELKGYKWVRIKLSVNNIKTKKSFPARVW